MSRTQTPHVQIVARAFKTKDWAKVAELVFNGHHRGLCVQILTDSPASLPPHIRANLDAAQ